jgi:ABC-2 type transport system permease protein
MSASPSPFSGPDTERPPPLMRAKPRSLRASVIEVIAARQIFRNMVRRDFVTKHKDSRLGLAWSLLNPILLVVIFSVVFYLFGITPSGDVHYPYALFFFGGLVLWNFFATTVTASTGSLVSAGYLLRKVYFPRELLPLSIMTNAAITAGFEMVVLIVFQTALGHPPTLRWVLTLPILAIAALLAYSIGLFLATATVYFRDLQALIGVIFQAWFWFTPVLYDLTFIDKKSHLATQILFLNPVTPLIVAWRDVTLNARLPGIWRLGYSALVAVLLWAAATAFFNRHERQIAELV